MIVANRAGYVEAKPEEIRNKLFTAYQHISGVEVSVLFSALPTVATIQQLLHLRRQCRYDNKNLVLYHLGKTEQFHDATVYLLHLENLLFGGRLTERQHATVMDRAGRERTIDIS